MFVSNTNSQEILQKLYLIAPNITTMFEENVNEYLNLDVYNEPVDFSKGIFVSINKCLDFKLLANIDHRTDVACLGYVYKLDGIYLFSYYTEYELIKISNIKRFECTETVYSEQYLNYKKYKKLF
ncbi:hypothetical protein RFF05_00520 [Bengtsoniella intestinalis]|uniref:hypothetical protein n=1 Tax=Bengtsoniella intestinalis TaxID=3073143 RepID=UPI00391F9204